MATSFEELNLADKDSYWHDSTRGWLHIKLIQSEDRTKGGTIVERDGNLEESQEILGVSMI